MKVDLSSEESQAFLSSPTSNSLADVEASASSYYHHQANSHTFSTMDSHNDPMVRDKKELPMSNTVEALAGFVGCSVVLLPIWLVVALPLTIASQAFSKVTGLILPKGKGQKFSVVDPKELIRAIAKKSSDTKREYDLVVYGATGFTGKMAAIYIAKQYGNKSFKWAIAGRRRDALEKVRAELAAIDADLAKLPILLSDSSDLRGLDYITKQTKAIITTAGPFGKYGENLVRSCAMHGTHYCDITGESDWVREMIDKYDEVAKVSGARLVSFCGHDCVPWDLSVLECQRFLKKKGESLAEISFFDEIVADPSGGTLDTVFHTLANRVQYKSMLGFDPMLKSTQGSKSENKLVVKNAMMLGYSSLHKAWIGPFVMAMVMANCVRRSNAINNYNTKLVYKEAAVYPSFFAGFVNVFGLIFFGTALFCPPLTWLLRTFFLPAPGQGPSEQAMDKGFLKLVGYAKGTNGTKAKSVFYFPTDPGYRDTARMLVESGLVLALEGDKVKVGGGYWTPASCQGELLTQRLVNSGSSFNIE